MTDALQDIQLEFNAHLPKQLPVLCDALRIRVRAPTIRHDCKSTQALRIAAEWRHFSASGSTIKSGAVLHYHICIRTAFVLIVGIAQETACSGMGLQAQFTHHGEIAQQVLMRGSTIHPVDIKV